MRRGFDLAILVGLLVVAFVLRAHQFDRIPYPNETADEYAFLWSGWSLLRDGTPTSWSWKEAYGAAPRYFANGTLYQIVTPWLDHPPLYSLFVGAAARLTSANELLDVPLRAGRAASVLLGSLAVGLLYALTRLTHGRAVATIAGSIFAVVPTMVLASRLVVAESLTVVLLLVGLLAGAFVVGARPGTAGADACASHVDSDESDLASGRPGRWLVWYAVALVAALLAPLAKVPGVAVGPAIAIVLAQRGRQRLAFGAALASLVGVALYVGYGAALSWPFFSALMADQSSRSTGMEVLSFLLTGASTGPVSGRDAWIPLLWLAAAYATFRRDRLLAALLIPYLIVVIATVDQSVPRVWYREPLFPGLCLAGAIFLRDTWRRPEALRVCLIVFALGFGKLAEGMQLWESIGVAGHRLYPLAVGLLATPIVGSLFWRANGWRIALRGEVGVVVAAALVASVVQVWQADRLYPAYHPSPYEEVAVPTSAGASIRRYAAAPGRLAPGETLRISAVWRIERDAGSLASQAVLRRLAPGGSPTNAAPVRLGTSADVSGKPGDEPTRDYSIVVPDDPPNADYEVSLDIAGEPVRLGIVRVRGR
jgi:hypothetical protein